MTVDEMTCCACGFSISGFGTKYLFSLLEQGILANIGSFQPDNLKEVCKAFIFSLRGSKSLLLALQPRIQTILPSLTCNELCYLLYGYFKANCLSKSLATTVEQSVLPTLRNTQGVTVEELALIAKVFCTTRIGTRDFHKLLEATILSRVEDLKKNTGVMLQIGLIFEESGLCSIDTLQILKKCASEA